MARARKDDQLLPSVLDRLIDDDPGNSVEPARSRNQILHELKACVRRDLQNLLNTRWRCEMWPPEFEQLETSLNNYGIPDFSGAQIAGIADRDYLIEAIRQAIKSFEPRFAYFQIAIVENKHEYDRTLRFKIEGLLHAEPAPEPVCYDTRLDMPSSDFKVQST